MNVNRGLMIARRHGYAINASGPVALAAIVGMVKYDATHDHALRKLHRVLRRCLKGRTRLVDVFKYETREVAAVLVNSYLK